VVKTIIKKMKIMKKTYIIPKQEVVHYHMKTMLLSGSEVNRQYEIEEDPDELSDDWAG